MLPIKLFTTINKIKLLSNQEMQNLFSIHEFLKEYDASESHQNNDLKAIISCSNYLGNKSLK
jgi:hypothetical protein